MWRESIAPNGSLWSPSKAANEFGMNSGVGFTGCVCEMRNSRVESCNDKEADERKTEAE